MFFNIIYSVRLNQKILQNIDKTIHENPDREFESPSHFIRSAILYYCKYLDDLKYKAGVEKINLKKEGKRKKRDGSK